MRNLTILFLLISILSCRSNKSENKVDKQETKTSSASKNKEVELIIGERIDGPANVRNKPNGEILFELKDNVLVEVTKPEDDWCQVLVYADIEYDEFGIDTIQKNRLIITNCDTIGRVLKSHSVSTGQGKDFSYAMLYGYTHKNNIKPETTIETVFKTELSKNGRKVNEWQDFIKSFNLRAKAIDYNQFRTFYNYENTIDDPSPGFRIVLIFEKEQLIGFIHSRDFETDNTKSHKLDWSYYVTFFNDYPEKEQMKFVKYMNEWIREVD